MVLMKKLNKNEMSENDVVNEVEKLEKKYKYYATLTTDLRLFPEYQIIFPDLCP